MPCAVGSGFELTSVGLDNENKDSKNTGFFTIAKKKESLSKAFNCIIVPLKEIIDGISKNNEKIIFAKIDVEGMESVILKELFEEIKRIGYRFPIKYEVNPKYMNLKEIKNNERLSIENNFRVFYEYENQVGQKTTDAFLIPK